MKRMSMQLKLMVNVFGAPNGNHCCKDTSFVVVVPRMGVNVTGVTDPFLSDSTAREHMFAMLVSIGERGGYLNRVAAAIKL